MNFHLLNATTSSASAPASWRWRVLLCCTLCLALGLGCSDVTGWRGAVPLRPVPPARPNQAVAEALRASASAVAHTWTSTHSAEDVAWNWGEGVLMLGLQRSRSLTADASIETYLASYYRAHLTRGIHVRCSDDATPALAALERVQQGDRAPLPLVEQVTSYVMQAPRSASGLLLHLGDAYPALIRQQFPDAWVDSVFHLVPTLLRYSTLTGDPTFRDLAAEQLQLFLRALSDPATGLITHAYYDAPRFSPLPAFEARAFWARGNGWMLASLVDALELLPKDHPAYPELRFRCLRLEVALRATQAPSGLFHTLLLVPDSYQETAGSALILYAMARGVRTGLFGAATRGAIEQGARGLYRVVRVKGAEQHVTGTSLGTNPVAWLYARTLTADDVSYGVGAWLIAVTEMLEVFTLEASP